MNDRYLFRAKRTDNGEWVCGGSIIRFEDHGIESFYMPDAHEKCICTHDEHDNITGFEDCTFYKVDPSTICQCTGFSDEDGKKIFDGDIVGFIDCISTEYGHSEHRIRGRVLWDEETGSFQVTERLSAESYEVLDGECKVLGNMFDNEELLEEW